MADDLQTVNPDQVPVVGTVPENAFVFVQVEGGPLQKVSYNSLLIKLIAAGLVKSNEATLQLDLAWAEDVVALVDNDPDPLKCGWWRKTGAVDAGEWVQFEQLSKAVLAAVQAIQASLTASVDAISTALQPGDPVSVLAEGADAKIMTAKERVIADIAKSSDQADAPEEVLTSLGTTSPAAGVVSTNFRKVVIVNDPALSFAADRIIRIIGTEFSTALAGRLAEFYLFDITGLLKWASGVIDASAAGELLFSLPDYLLTEAGDYLGIWNSAALAADGILVRDNQANGPIGQILYNQTALLPQLTVGETYDAGTEGYTSATRYLPAIYAVHSPKQALVATRWANKANGWAKLDANARAPMKIMPDAISGSKRRPADETTEQTFGRLTTSYAEAAGRLAITCTSDISTVAGKLQSARVKTIGATAARSVAFWAYDDSGAVTWHSDAIPAPDTGTYEWVASLEDDIAIAIGSGVGATVDTEVSGNGKGIAVGIDAAAIAGNTVRYKSTQPITSPAVGENITSGTWGAHDDYEVQIEYTVQTKDGVVTVGYLGKANGAASLDASGKVPLGQMPSGAGALTDLATALTVPASPAAAADSQTDEIVLVIGNSIDAGGAASASGGDAHYGVWQQTRDYLGWTLHNLAVPGSLITGWAADENSVRTDALALAGLTKIIIGFGENDALLTVGSSTDLYPGNDTFAGRLNQIIDDLGTAFPSASIFLRSNISPWPTYGGAQWGPPQWLDLKQIDAVREQIAIEQGLEYLDFREFLPRPPFVGNFLADGLHPGDLGHTEILTPIAIQFFGGF
ncbi:SGNH/GDSL hydrolase family protein [Novosphingobium naphthalenivorans]|uniref:SGNH/GDSL hydrolase family protein n=1 Tax=Novosphingobium naphthalenivorans TaxID=273168 RepID=UPI000834536D|nr:SGNH/GDSL hydrolase family protein [Novosphingobium naphthalenivorans]